VSTARQAACCPGWRSRGSLAVWPVPAVVAAAWVFRVPGSPGVPGVPAVPGCGGRAVAAAGREPPQCGIDTVRTVAL